MQVPETNQTTAPTEKPVETNDLKDPDISTASVIDKDNLTENEKKLSTPLLIESKYSQNSTAWEMAETEQELITGNSPAADALTLYSLDSASNGISSDNLVYVYVYMLPGYSTHLIDTVAEVCDRDEANNFAVAWVDVEDLNALASIEGVRAVREVIEPGVNIGSVTTEGDIVHKTADVRSKYGYNGKGVKIGIISNGVDSLSDSQESGDLPDDVHVLRNDLGGDEGTAMLEIVYDMVPGAELYFHDSGSNVIEFNSAIDTLISNGCNVICDDVYWSLQPYFEDGTIASHVESVLSDNDIIYLTSAGNAAEEHYQGDFYDSGNGFHDFSSGTSSDRKSLYVSLPTYSSVTIILEWNDKFGSSSNDYDLYLSNVANSSSEVVYGDLTYSEDTQDGSGDPLEYFGYFNPGPYDITAEIDIKKNNSADVKTLELFIRPRNGAWVYDNNIVAEDSVFGHGAVPDVVTVAAVDWSTPSTIESYSSRGPVTISYPSPEIRAKPEITGVDGVNVTGAGGFSTPFYGTSAAAPHIAAIAAQIWGAYPSMTADEVRAALYNSTVDLGTAGKDTTFGYGLADALALADSLYNVVTPTPTQGIKTVSGSGGSNTDTGIGFDTDLKAGSNASFKMDKGTVSAVSITAGTDIPKLMLTVQKESSLPSSIEEPDMDVYEYEDVTVYYADESDLSGGILDFRVGKSWLESNGYSANDVVMLHYDEKTGEWKELETSYTGETDEYYNYSAETPFFSWFAIAASEDETVVSGETHTVSPTRVATMAVTSNSSIAATTSTVVQNDSAAPEEPGSWNSPVIVALLIVIVAVIIAVLAGRSK